MIFLRNEHERMANEKNSNGAFPFDEILSFPVSTSSYLIDFNRIQVSNVSPVTCLNDFDRSINRMQNYELIITNYHAC